MFRNTQAHPKLASTSSVDVVADFPRESATPSVTSPLVSQHTKPLLPSQTPGPPVQHQPLLGALTGSASIVPKPRPRATIFAGPVVRADELGEMKEKELLKNKGGPVVVAAFQAFDASRPQVLLVHGIDGAPDSLQDFAQRLHDQGHQVLVAYYDDRGKGLDAIGDALAQALTTLAANHPPKNASLDIVAHSMGGIVSRLAINKLTQKGAIGVIGTLESEDIKSFVNIKVHSIDTPWDGYNHEPEIPVLGAVIRPLIKFIMTLFGWRSAFDMRANSKVFASLYATPLTGVSFRYIVATQKDGSDHVRCLEDLHPQEKRDVARFVETGRQPQGVRARNFTLALQAETHFMALQREHRDFCTQGGVDEKTKLDHLNDALRKYWPHIEATHGNIVADDSDSQLDAVDRVVMNIKEAT
jgi:pimeloyl-ACP methyl ester carboxylesterase